MTDVASLQLPDGSFMGDHWGEVDTRFSYCALNALALLGRMNRINVDKAVEFIGRCRNFDGGFGAVPGAESHSGQIWCCVAALALVGPSALERHVDASLLGWWLAERQLPCGGLNGRPEKKNDVCFGIDTRVMTDRGFLFIDEIESHIAAGRPVLYAAYDIKSKSIVYRQGMLQKPENKDHKLVTFAGSHASHFSIRVTAGHRIFVQTGAVRGGSVECDCSRDRKRIDKPHRVMTAQEIVDKPVPTRWLSFAANGLDGDSSVVTAELSKLGLNTSEQQTAFLELYGFWLGDGTMLYDSGNQCVQFSLKKQDDIEFIRERLSSCGLQLGRDFVENNEDSRGLVTFRIQDARWFEYFDREYGVKYRHSQYYNESTVVVCVKSGKWFFKWLLRCLSRVSLRLVIEGLRRADGDWSAGHNRIFTSSDTFKDELLLALMHAGYAPYYQLYYAKGSIRGYAANPNQDGTVYSLDDIRRVCSATQVDLINEYDTHNNRTDNLPYHPIRAAASNYVVYYCDDSSPKAGGLCQPHVDAEDVKEEEYHDRIWCVTVDHPDSLIIAQQAQRENGVVTAVSRPVITGNCYSWWVLSSLAIIRRIRWIDCRALGEYILECQDKEKGGISDRPGNMADVFHTYFGMAGLSLLGYPNLEPIDPVYAMPSRIVQQLKLPTHYSTL